MNLVAFGCSYVEGSITQGPNQNNLQNAKKISFVKRLEEYNKNITSSKNYGERGMSNEMIVHDVYRYLKKGEQKNKEIMLVSWSGVTRPSFYKWNKDQYKRVTTAEHHYHGNKDPYFIYDSLQAFIYKLAKMYNKYIIFTSAFVPWSHLTQVYSANDLKEMNYLEPKYFRNTLSDIIALRFKSHDVLNPGVVNYELKENQWINDQENHFDFNDNIFVEPCRHPSAEGHKLIAKTLSPYIDRLLETGKL